MKKKKKKKGYFPVLGNKKQTNWFTSSLKESSRQYCDLEETSSVQIFLE